MDEWCSLFRLHWKERKEKENNYNYKRFKTRNRIAFRKKTPQISVLNIMQGVHWQALEKATDRQQVPKAYQNYSFLKRYSQIEL